MNAVGNFFNTLAENASRYFNNFSMSFWMIVIEGTICFIIGYACVNCFKIFFISGSSKDDALFSRYIDKILMSGGLYYIFKFIDAFLYSKCR